MRTRGATCVIRMECGGHKLGSLRVAKHDFCGRTQRRSRSGHFNLAHLNCRQMSPAAQPTIPSAL